MRFLAMAACILVTGCTASATAEPVPRHPAIVVVDGDTLRIDGERVRIANMDAPELGDHARCWAEAALAQQAKRELESIVGTYPDVTLQRVGTDRYGRTLALVAAHGHDIGEAMVTQGYASEWTGHRWDWCDPTDFHRAGGPVLGIKAQIDAEARGAGLR